MIQWQESDWYLEVLRRFPAVIQIGQWALSLGGTDVFSGCDPALGLGVLRWFPASHSYIGMLGSVVSFGVAMVSPCSDPIVSCLVPPGVGVWGCP